MTDSTLHFNRPQDPTNGLAWALAYAEAGLPVLPIHSPTPTANCDCGKINCSSPAKHPRTKRGVLDATTDPEQITSWWRMWPDANAGIAVPVGFIVLDADVEDIGDAVGDRPLPATATQRTPRPGSHLVYRTMVPIPPKVGILPHVDLRGPGSYIVAAPSIHANGGRYDWTTGLDEGVAEAPDWIADLATARRSGPTGNGGRRRIPEGERHATLLSYAGSMRNRGLEPDEILPSLLAVNRSCDPPLPEEEVRRLAESMAAYPAGETVIRPTAGDGPDLLGPPADQAWPAPIDDDAYQGLAGEIVSALAPTTEADEVGLLGTLLVLFGAVVGRGRTYWHGADHGPNLFLTLVGPTSTGRKGTAWSVTGSVLDRVAPGWRSIVVPGIGSGEGLVTRLKPADGDGPPDPRALILETEMSRLLIASQRDGSTLGAVLRSAWDGTPLGSFLARRAALVTDHHVSLLAHITPEDLRDKLRDVDAANGFGNRFLWLAVRRSRRVPFPERPDRVLAPDLTRKLHEAIAVASVPSNLTLSPDAADRWEEVYTALSTDRWGLLGALTSRAEAQVIRLAIVYALLDRSTRIDIDHLDAAVALWDYSERSARYIFGDSTGNALADFLRRHLRDCGEISKTEIKQFESRPRARQQAIDVLVGLGLARIITRPHGPGGGRPTTFPGSDRADVARADRVRVDKATCARMLGGQQHAGVVQSTRTPSSGKARRWATAATSGAPCLRVRITRGNPVPRWDDDRARGGEPEGPPDPVWARVRSTAPARGRLPGVTGR